MIRNRRWLSGVLCAVMAVVAIGLIQPIHANANDVWIATVEGQPYQLECGQQEFTVSGDNMEQPKVVQGTLLGACSWEKELWMLIGRQDGTYLASYMPYYQIYQEYTGEEGAPLVAGQEDFSLGVTTDGVFVYMDTDGTAVGYRVDQDTSLCTLESNWQPTYASIPAVQQPVSSDSFSSSMPVLSSSEPSSQESSSSEISSTDTPSSQSSSFPASSVEPPASSENTSSDGDSPLDCGVYRFEKSITVAELIAQYQKLVGDQRPGAQITAWTAGGVEIKTGWIPTGGYIAENWNGKWQYCTVVVTGDLTGSGQPDQDDYQILRAVVASGDDSTLSSLQFDAADINQDQKLDTADLLLLKKLIT